MNPVMGIPWHLPSPKKSRQNVARWRRRRLEPVEEHDAQDPGEPSIPEGPEEPEDPAGAET